MPFAYFSCLIGCLAIAGIPPFSGFWSKDEILLSAWISGNYGVFFAGLLTGGLTAFYMFRMFFLTFHGQPRSEHVAKHEDPWMTFPIVLLAVPAAGAGFAGHSVLGNLAGHHVEWLPIAASLMGVFGLAIAWFLYARKNADVVGALESDIRSPWYKIIYNKFYFDEIYYSITRNFLIKGVAGFLKAFDHYIIDALGDFIALVLHWCGRGVRLAQNGFFAAYAALFVTGLVFGMWLLVGF